ncbi:MAG: DUF4234 domain-containing protein [Clostridia bacterium]|nr:DUF4234 domain-containing protein [Clostridia bacterium]
MTKKEIWVVIVLSIFTFGIYYLYWIYSFSNDIKVALDDTTINPTLELLLTIITCGIYGYYWMYKYGKLIATAQDKYNLTIEDNAILYLILAIFGFSIVNQGIMQSQINNIIDAKAE